MTTSISRFTSEARQLAAFEGILLGTAVGGGDTDTVGAVLGALCGANGGPDVILSEWIDRLAEWPRSVAFMREVAMRLTERQKTGQPVQEVRYFWSGIFLRNLMFIAVVLLHGFRRLLPPY